MSVNMRKNAMAIFSGEQPAFYGDFMDTMTLCPDPILLRDLAPMDGQPHKDSWGTTIIWLEGAPGQHPVVTDENKVIKDIVDWEKYVKVPPVEGLDWTACKQVAATVNTDEMFLGYFCPCGLFERAHFLMGMEDAFCAYLEEPEAMHALLETIKEYKIACIEEAAKQFHPDAIFYHDDWGSKQNLFLPPDTWREFIKPLQTEISECIHDNGMIYIHHSDCYCAPIVEDMVDIGIDAWQGVIAQNPIPEIQERTHNKLTMIGGIDGPALDIEVITEEEIRQSVRDAFDRCLPGGRFFPSIPNGQCFREWNDRIVKEEALKYGRQWALDHPKGEQSPEIGEFDYDELYEKIVKRTVMPSEDDAK